MKGLFKRGLCLGMSLSLALSLCACGKDSGESADPAGSPAQQDQAAAGGYAYAATHKQLDSKELPAMLPMYLDDSGFYAVGMEKVGEATPEGVRPEYEGQYDIKQPMIYRMGLDGSSQKLEQFQPSAAPEDYAGRRDLRSTSTIEALGVDEEGNVVALEEQYISWNEAPQDVKPDQPEYSQRINSETHYWLHRLDKSSGSSIVSAELSFEEDFAPYLYNSCIDSKGNAYIPGSSGGIAVFNALGESLGTVPSRGYTYDIGQLKDGRMGILMFDDSTSSLVVRILNVDDMSLGGESYPVPLSAMSIYPGGGEYDLYYSNDSELCGYRLDTKQEERLFSWINCDVDGSGVVLFRADDEGKYHAMILPIGSTDEHFTATLSTVSKVPASQLAEKTHLSLASVEPLDYRLQQEIIKFNRSRDDVHIDLKDYSSLNSSDNDWQGGYTKLSTEIMAGNVPDLLLMSDFLPYRQIASKGLLEDLYPYLDSDPQLKREDFFQNVLSAMEVNGGLYLAPSGFGVMTLAGASSIVGDEPGWTFADYNEALAKMPEGAEGLGFGYDRDTMLEVLLACNSDSFVDWSSKSCHFDSEAFVSLLEFAAQFPSADQINYEDMDASDSDASRIAQGKQMLAIAAYSSTGFIPYDYAQMFGGDVTFIGFPTAEGVGTVITPGSSIAMSAQCKDKQAAWDFLKLILGKDFQKDASYLPTNRLAFEESLAKAMEVEYEKDANGNFLLDENGERIPVSLGAMFDGTTTTEIYATSESQAEQLRQVVNSASKLLDMDKTISDMAKKEAAPFFAGQKTAQEVAKLLQSKMSLYINEQG